MDLANPLRIRAAVFGATGYTGIELVRLLTRHPNVELAVLTSENFVGKRLSEVYPAFAGTCDAVLEPADVGGLSPRFDLAFTALPHGVSMEVVAALVAAGKRVIDLSADFRLRDPNVYARWYRPHQAQEILAGAVYGLTELHREELRRATLVAVPGCYPTAAILGLFPLFRERLVESDIVIDAKSGVTGAGRSASVELSFGEVNENFKAYGVAGHRHTPEIEQELGLIAKQAVQVIFVPHLVPMNRGILSTAYARVKEPITDSRLETLYRQAYEREPFVRVLPVGVWPQTKDVRGTNVCAIGYHAVPGSRHLLVISAIDNLVKGAAGQAVQNMNVMYGLPEETGLLRPGFVP
ncbi:MAG TPA: N-acetyl-gamma-glutamyl-phosphate reductase [Candidatus Acidoferrales bacterium]|nr:N-acetyl-gamma-glutamyl-phosphate reductase [Candidatus Acidoferrales bacterium]